MSALDDALLRVFFLLLVAAACVCATLMMRRAAFFDDAWTLPMTVALAGTAYLRLEAAAKEKAD
jgi:hypothetical protein